MESQTLAGVAYPLVQYGGAGVSNVERGIALGESILLNAGITPTTSTAAALAVAIGALRDSGLDLAEACPPPPMPDFPLPPFAIRPPPATQAGVQLVYPRNFEPLGDYRYFLFRLPPSADSNRIELHTHRQDVPRQAERVAAAHGRPRRW